jgi:hypothetical protein
MKRLLFILSALVCLHSSPIFSLDLFSSALLHEQLDWIKNELDTADIKALAPAKMQLIQDGILNLETDVAKKIKKTEAKLQKYSEKISQIKEEGDLQSCLKAIKSLEDELKNFNTVLTAIEEMKVKIRQ